MTEPPAARPLSPIDRAFLTHVEGVTEVILVRHGQQHVPDPATAKIGEWINPPLSSLGERQASAVGRALASSAVDAVYSSNLVRARRTGEAIAAHHGLEVTVVEDLREIETFRDLPRDQHPMDALGELVLRGARERFVRHRTWDVYPGSEPHAEFRHRTMNALEGILSLHSGQRIVVACHGGVINALFGEVLGIDVAMFFRPAHASIHRLGAHEGVRVLQSLNETHHLAGESDDLVSY